MVRILIILALAYGAYWCYNNVDFANLADNAKTKLQSEKTINAVTKSRQQNADAVNDAMSD